MKKIFSKVLLIICIGILLSGCSQGKITEKMIEEATKTISRPSTSGALWVNGAYLCDKKNKPIQLRGMSTHGISWFPDYVNQEFFTELANEWNANVVRISMYTMEYAGYCNGGDREELKALVKEGIDYATQADMYVIVDWHTLSDGNPSANVDEAIQFFDEISALYSDADNVLYEICNEPNGVGWADIREYALKVIPVIRNNDKDAVILVGTPNWCQYPSEISKAPLSEYDNIMYTLHFYAASHGKNNMEEINTCMQAGIPLFVSEFGICDSSGSGELDYDTGNEWINMLNKYAISYVQWNISNNAESSAAFNEKCSKVSMFTEDDLSDHSKWMKEKMDVEK